MEEYSFLLAIATVFVLGTVSPGPSFILTAKTALSKSSKEGFGVAIGLGLGSALFSLLAIFGLYAILETVPFLYGSLKIIGGMYLIYLAYKMWKYSDMPLNTQLNLEQKPKSFIKAILLGFATQMSNPKTAIIIGSIFAALLPQTIPAFGTFLVCLIAFIIDASWYSCVVVLLSMQKAQKAYLRAKKYIDKITGSVLGILGFKLALDRS